MDENELLHRHKKLLGCLSGLPKQMMAVDTLDNITEFVLHGLCNKDCFDLERAAYFVDNPDFDCFKGVAGFVKSEHDCEWDNLWADPESFAASMQKSNFNQKVRTFLSRSMANSNKDLEGFVNEVAKELGFSKPACSSWDMKYFNKGILIYEKSGNADFDEHLLNSLYLLSFCPVF